MRLHLQQLQGIDDPSDRSAEYVTRNTDSLRHTFATRFEYADVAESVLDELLGHKVEKLSVGRYGKRYPVEKLREAVERLKV
jgi:integrase